MSSAIRNSFSTTRSSALGGQGVPCRTECAAKRKCQRQGGLWAAVSEPSINPKRATSAMIDWQKALTAELGRSRCCVCFYSLRAQREIVTAEPPQLSVCGYFPSLT